MASKYWLKLYHEMLDDPKVMTLRPALRWRFIETLLVAGEMDEGGLLPPVEKYAWRVRDRAELVETELNELSDAGLLSREDGQWLVTKFAERQAPVKAAERMRRMRRREKKKEYYGDDTPSERARYDAVTNRNTDTDTDIEEDKDNSARDGGGDTCFAEAIATYEDNIGLLAPIVSDKIKDAVDKHPDGWVVDAIGKAAEAGKRNWRYINGILRNWEEQGHQDTGPRGSTNGRGMHPVDDEYGGYYG